jgi:hypothetical protein
MMIEGRDPPMTEKDRTGFEGRSGENITTGSRSSNEVTGSIPTAAPLRFQGKLSWPDVWNIALYQYYCLNPWSKRWGDVGILLYLAFFAWMFQLSIGWYAFLAVGFFLVWAVCFLLAPLNIRRTAWREYRQHEVNYPETRVTLSPECITLDNVDNYQSLEWEGMLILATPDGLLFGYRTGWHFWLPVRLFEGNDLREQVLHLAESKSTKIIHISRSGRLLRTPSNARSTPDLRSRLGSLIWIVSFVVGYLAAFWLVAREVQPGGKLFHQWNDFWGGGFAFVANLVVLGGLIIGGFLGVCVTSVVFWDTFLQESNSGSKFLKAAEQITEQSGRPPAGQTRQPDSGQFTERQNGD